MIPAAYINIPNAISLSRLLGVPVLFVLIHFENKLWFVGLYSILGFTDWLDGKLARKWNQVTEFGSMMDSVADLVYYLSTAYFLIYFYPEYLTPNLPYLYFFFIVFGTSIIISKVKLGRILFIHTHLSRWGAVFLFAAFLLSFYADTTYLIRTVIFMYTLAFVEVSIMFLKFGNIDPDTRTILWLVRGRQISDE